MVQKRNRSNYFTVKYHEKRDFYRHLTELLRAKLSVIEAQIQITPQVCETYAPISRACEGRGYGIKLAIPFL
jgi:hypothetical protein